MPQMAPISWLLLFFFFSLIFIMFNMLNYFIYYPLINKSKMTKKINLMNLHWKW
nr:ATP synthase F0 subunit 8 [Asarkina ericetorum]